VGDELEAGGARDVLERGVAAVAEQDVPAAGRGDVEVEVAVAVEVAEGRADADAVAEPRPRGPSRR
jgi:hypothetical protein